MILEELYKIDSSVEEEEVKEVEDEVQNYPFNVVWKLKQLAKKKKYWNRRFQKKNYYNIRLYTPEQSEKSYEQLISRGKLELQIVNLIFNDFWNCFITGVHMYSLFVYSYYNIFLTQEERIEHIVSGLFILSGWFIIFDICVSVYHRIKGSPELPYPPISWWWIVINSVLTLIQIIRMFHKIPFITVTLVFVSMYSVRAMIAWCRYGCSISVAKVDHFGILFLFKFIYPCVFFVHVFTSLWMLICWVDCKASSHNWRGHQTHIVLKHGVAYFRLGEPSVNNNLTGFDYYKLCLFHIIGPWCSSGKYGGASPRNNIEQGVIMLVNFSANIVFFPILFSSFSIMSHLGKLRYLSKLRLIDQHFMLFHVSKAHAVEVRNYYLRYVEKVESIKETALFLELPSPLKSEILLDKYWFALKKCYFFTNASEPLLCEIAWHMQTVSCNAGEVIFPIGHATTKMVFVCKGALKILSEDDTENALFTLGAGSCIGAFNLIYTRTGTYEIKAASYCVLQVLTKTDLWHMLDSKCRNRQLIRSLHLMAQNKIDMARLHLSRQERDPTEALLKMSKMMPEEVNMFDYNVDLHLESTYMQSNIKQKVTLDKIFIKTTWPWVLHPQSEMNKIWGLIIVALHLNVIVWYPYKSFVFDTSESFLSLILILELLVGLCYPLDICVSLMTAVENEFKYETSFIKILEHQAKFATFYTDLLAAVPFELIGVFDFGQEYKKYSLCRLAKFFSVQKFVNKQVATCRGDVFVLEVIKYFVYTIFFSYFFCAVRFLVYCPTLLTCNNNTWTYIVTNNEPPIEKVIHEFYFMVNVFTMTSYPKVSDMQDVNMAIVFVIIAYISYVALQIALHGIYKKTRVDKDVFFRQIHDLMNKDSGGANVTSQRIKHYLTQHWHYFACANNSEVLDNIPHALKMNIKRARYSYLLHEQKLYDRVDEEIIKLLAEKCDSFFVPPNETIVYEGQAMKSYYIMEKGYCEVICSSGRILKELKRGDCFCLIEMLLGQPSFYTYKAKTHCMVIYLTKEVLLSEIFMTYKGLQDEIYSALKGPNSHLSHQRLFRRKPHLQAVEVMKEENTSWIIFSKNRRHPAYLKYDSGNAIINKLCKCFLMRRTIVPDATSLIVYEKIHVIVVIFTCIYVPLMHFYRIYWQGFFYMSIIFDILGYIDIYIRFHVCYYNKHKILISHPMNTAWHYLTSAFLTDFVATLPVEKVIEATLSSTDYWNYLLSYNRALQLYRFKFINFQKNIFQKTPLSSIILIGAILEILIINYLSTMLMFISTKIRTQEMNTTLIVNLEYAIWKGAHIYGATLFSVHIKAILWTVSLFFNYTFISGVPNVYEKIWATLVMLLGYFYNIIFFIIIATFMTTVHQKLMENREDDKEIKKFMNDHKITNNLQNLVNVYFEYRWTQTQGARSMDTVSLCHSALKVDWTIRFFTEVLKKVPPFGNDLGEQVAEVLGEHLQEMFCVEETIIVDYNDIVDKVYIIRSGEVRVSDHSGKLVEVMSAGSLFGHIDNVSMSRCPYRVTSLEPIALWYMKTELMYEKLVNIPFVLNRIMYYIVAICPYYVLSSEEIWEKQLNAKKLLTAKLQQTRIRRWLVFVRGITSKYLEGIYLLATLLSIYWLFFIISFDNSSYILVQLLIFYLFDLIYFMQIITDVILPYARYRTVGKRKVSTFYKSLIFHIFIIFPFELIPLSFGKEYLFLAKFFRINRILKLKVIINFLYKNFSNLSTSRIMLSVSLFGGSTLVIVIFASVSYYVTCPERNCSNHSWVYLQQGKTQRETFCDIDLICSLYYSSSFYTMTGVAYTLPQTALDCVTAVCMTIISKIITNVLFGQIYLLVIHDSSPKVRFITKVIDLRRFIMSSTLSYALVKKVDKYVKYLWFFSNGKQAPKYLKLLPTHLNIALKYNIYGHHVLQHPIFIMCHADFTRQLILHMELEIYFANNTICRFGEINETMYFIHKGNVDVYEISDEADILVDVLWDGDSFGLVQGLFSCVPHNYKFVAKTTTIIIKLRRGKWKHLLLFFPMSKYQIYDNFLVEKKKSKKT